MAYPQIYNWIVGEVIVIPAAQAADGSWSAVFSRAGGHQSQAIWNPAGNAVYAAWDLHAIPGSGRRNQRHQWAGHHREHADLAGMLRKLEQAFLAIHYVLALL